MIFPTFEYYSRLLLDVRPTNFNFFILEVEISFNFNSLIRNLIFFPLDLEC
jgi:hypothetical protein